MPNAKCQMKKADCRTLDQVGSADGSPDVPGSLEVTGDTVQVDGCPDRSQEGQGARRLQSLLLGTPLTPFHDLPPPGEFSV